MFTRNEVLAGKAIDISITCFYLTESGATVPMKR
nr:MAG TPA_asm: hypothetical protein [Caudoviricetes sp.]